MYARYAALFSLRNRGGREAIRAIISALECQSALLKHEVN
jgi:deoxyhypusine monooxygenase